MDRQRFLSRFIRLEKLGQMAGKLREAIHFCGYTYLQKCIFGE